MTIKKYLILIIGLTCMFAGLSSAKNVLKWTNTIKGGNFLAMALDNNDNVIITGESNTSIFTLKYSNNRSISWYRKSAWNISGQGKAVAIDKQNNVYVAGYKAVPAPSYDYFTIKYSNNGNIQWTNWYDVANDFDMPNGIALDNNGNCYVIGQSKTNSLYYSCLIKYNSTGGFVKRVLMNYSGGATGYYGRAITIDPSGYIYTMSGANWGGSVDENIFIAKYDFSLNLIKTNNYKPDSSSYTASKAILDKFGNLYIAGNKFISGNTYSLVLKMNSNLGFQWERTYGNTGQCKAFGIAINSQNDIYVVGGTNMAGGFYQIPILKYNMNGDAISTNFFQSSWSQNIDIGINTNSNKIFIMGDRAACVIWGVPPDKPNNLVGTCIGTNKIAWLWNDNSINEGGFQLQDSTTNAILDLMPNTTKCTEFNLALNPNQKVIRHITVTNNLGNVDSLNASNYTACLPLHKPLTAVYPNSTELDISWTINRGGAARYLLQRTVTSNSGWVTRYSNTATNFVDNSGLSAGTKYWYRAAALNGDLIASDFITNSFTTTGAGGTAPIIRTIKTTNVSGALAGEIMLKVIITNIGPGVTLDFKYKSLKAGIDWKAAKIKAYSSPVSTGTNVFTWQSANDLPGKYIDDIIIQVTPDNGIPGTPKSTAELTVNNISFTGPNDVHVDNSFQNMNTSDKANILFQAQSAEDVTITIYDLKGRKIWSKTSVAQSGSNLVTWDYKDSAGKKVASDVYAIHIKGAGVDKTLKMSVYR
jgi:hypothetical protein